jgi:hypothetical protein
MDLRRLHRAARTAVWGLSLGLLVACGGSSATSVSTPAPTLAGASPAAISPAPTATPTPRPATPAAPPVGVTPTRAAAAASPPAAPAAPTPKAVATEGGRGTAGTPDYLDDRSSGESLIRSYYNAINRREYARAYSYWMPGTSSDQLPPFQQFREGYVDTESVTLTIGTVTSGVGAGQIYYGVPVLLDATSSGGVARTFVGCYLLHIGRPVIQAVPPFHPLAIQSATIQGASAGNPQQAMATACEGVGAEGQSVGTPAPDSRTNIASANYLDDRSTPEQTVRSLYNAVNRKEYVRAYSYWDPNAPQLQPFDQFQSGYQNTSSVQLTLGTATTDAGAGQLNYAVPAAIAATTIDGQTTTFVGCYMLHLTNPALQTDPPYQPMAIRSANVQQVTGGNPQEMLGRACSR